MTDRTDAAGSSTLLQYARLLRLPNVFTAFADVTMGFFFVRQSLDLTAVWICLAASSGLLYSAGMVLNDVYDVEVDAQERPFRPIPSGQIGVGWARWLGYQLLLVGVAAGALAPWLDQGRVALSWRSGVVAIVLAVCIVLYDALLKATWTGPLVMGSCRFLNVLLGMSVALAAEGPSWTLGYDTSELIVAGGLGLYIVGVTWFARTEAVQSSRPALLLGAALMLSGIGLLAAYPTFGLGGARMNLSPDIVWPFLLAVLTVTIARRCVVALLDPQPPRIQAAVKHAILSLIVLDASVCLAVQPHEPYVAIALVALLVPTLLLGRWVYST